MCENTDKKLPKNITERRKIEDELQESERQYRKLIQYAPTSMCELNLRSKKFTSVNEAMCELLGYTREELLQMSPFDLLDEQGKITFQYRINRWLAGERPVENVEYTVTTKDGRRIFIILNVTLIPDQEGNPQGVTVIAHDITERKQVEDTLRKSEEKFKAISIASPVAVIVSRGDKHLYVNPAAVSILGYTEEELLKMSFTDIVHPDYQDIIKRLIEARMAGDEKQAHYEVKVLTKTSAEKWVDVSTNLIYYEGLPAGIVNFTDITERKRKTEEILASERKLLKITLDSLTEGVITTDNEGIIIFINRSAAALTGYHPDEAIGRSIDKVFYIINNRTSEPMILRASERIVDNLVLVTGELNEIPITVNTSPIKSNDGEVIGMVIVFQDITERQRTEQELLKTEKLQSLGVMAGGIAHDFNNILAAILANIQLAIFKLEKDEDIRTYLSNTMNAACKASDLTKQLLTFSRGGAPVKKDASLIDLVKDTTEFALRGSKIVAKYVIPDDLWVVSVDEGQISQVIHNLVINAKQAMAKGGVIKINAENIIIQEHKRFQPGYYVKITVKDQGSGISKENLGKIFDPFFTTKKDGNGLGLATSYSIITRHNGYLEVESREGEGATFFIYLPALIKEAEKEEAQKEVVTASGRGLKILLMDDNVDILNAVGEMLKNNGHQVVLTTDGTEVIDYYQSAKKLNEPFDVVIMDLTVPGGLGGQEAIAHLRDFDPDIKAIVSSGYANDPIIAEYERFGFCGFVIKPYRFDELKEVLNRVVQR